MTPETIAALTALITWIRDGGTLAMFVLITVGGYRGWFVWGWQYEDLKKELEAERRETEMWRNHALKSTQLADRLTGRIASEGR